MKEVKENTKKVKETPKRKKRAKKKIRRICQYCKTEFIASRKDRKFCSKECSAKGQKKGWPPKIDLVELLAKIKPFLQLGLSIRQACLNAKVSYDTVMEKKNDKTTESPEIREFRDGIEVAKNYAVMKAKQVIVWKIAEGDDYNARWWLNKRDPDFADKQKVEHDGSVGVTMNWGIPRSPYVDDVEADKEEQQD